MSTHLFVRSELECRFRDDLHDVDAVASPHAPKASLLQQLVPCRAQSDVEVATGEDLQLRVTRINM